MKKKEARWYALATEDVLQRLDTRTDGLSPAEAAARLERDGPNSFGEQEQVSAWKIVLDQFASPLIYVLLAAFVVTALMGHWADAIVITIVLLVNAVVGFFQESRAEQAIQALMQMVSPKARVRRGGTQVQVASEELVVGDVLLLGEGDVVSADARLLDAGRLQVEEAALTGESVPVRKGDEAVEGDALPPSDQTNMVFMGTSVTAGSATAIVVATGEQTEMGGIATEIRGAGDRHTPLQQRMNTLGRQLALVVLGTALAAFGLALLLGHGLEDTFLLAVALAVAIMPAGLPVVMTIALAVSVRRMASRNAVIRRLPAVETLGSTTVIVSDKTGTLTQNRMTVAVVEAGGERHTLGEGESVDAGEGTPLRDVLLAGVLNNGASLDPRSGDPMDIAMLAAGEQGGLHREALLERMPLMEEVPFEAERRYSATIHELDGEVLVLVKGAPEAIAAMCSRRRTASGDAEPMSSEDVIERIDPLAAEGLRVLAMATGRGEDAARAVRDGDAHDLVFAGLQGLLDPPRPEAVKAVDQCHAAGIRVMMVTGDHAQTAAAIAREVHLHRPVRFSREPATGSDGQGAGEDALPAVITGRELEELSDEELSRALERTNVFARAQPAQKLRLVKALKARGEVVAVTGDGVNDAPALKEAHLGVAMGEAGTDVAKQASEMVLTDDNFASIYAAVEEGRTAFRNIRMATFFLLSCGLGEAIAILASLLLGMPLPLLPAQILWLNVVTNSVHDIALAFERGERSLFERPPRAVSEGVLSRVLVVRTALVGTLLAAGSLGMFWWETAQLGRTVEYARVAALSTLVVFQWFHLFNCRSEDESVLSKPLFSNPLLFWGALGAFLLHLGVLYFPPTQRLLRLEPLMLDTWLRIFAVSASVIVVNEAHKRLGSSGPDASPSQLRPEGVA